MLSLCLIPLCEEMVSKVIDGLCKRSMLPHFYVLLRAVVFNSQLKFPNVSLKIPPNQLFFLLSLFQIPDSNLFFCVNFLRVLQSEFFLMKIWIFKQKSRYFGDPYKKESGVYRNCRILFAPLLPSRYIRLDILSHLYLPVVIIFMRFK